MRSPPSTEPGLAFVTGVEAVGLILGRVSVYQGGAGLESSPWREVICERAGGTASLKGEWQKGCWGCRIEDTQRVCGRAVPGSQGDTMASLPPEGVDG